MPVPTSYTETGLADYMKSVLAETAEAINWITTPGSYQEAVNETLIAYGVDDIAEATDIKKLRVIARREVWRAVADATVGNYRFGSDREIYHREQVHRQAVDRFAKASEAAARYVTDDDSTSAVVTEVVDLEDPYVLVDVGLIGID